MRTVTAHTTNAWKGMVKAGPTRPVVRATIEWGRVKEHSYNTDDMQGGQLTRFGHRTRKGIFRNIVFGNNSVRELRNVRSISWSRSLDQDVAECTLTLLNTDVTPIGDASEVVIGNDFELPGLFTFSRGSQTEAQTRWGYTTDTGWQNQIVPDRLVRTYEGYGSDDSLPPGEDPHLYPSGVWLIDEVDYNANGDIQIKMRDLGRLLIDHIVFPPVVPRDDYPLTWEKITNQQVDAPQPEGGEWNQPPGSITTSNATYIGAGLVDRPYYINTKGVVQGHYPAHAWRAGLKPNGDNDWDKYWLSSGMSTPKDMVWWEVELNDPAAIAALRISTRSGPYRLYISLQNAAGEWVGKKKIPYTPGTAGIDNGAKVPFVKTVKSEKAFDHDVTLPRVYGNIKKVRITWTRLRRLIPADTYQYRAGLRNLKLYTAATAGELSIVDGTTTEPIGNYRDFTDIVRWVGAWAGFYWPERGATIRYDTDGTPYDHSYNFTLGALPKGATWGSFQDTGTAGQAALTSDQWDKQPLMDVISHLREIVAHNFWIDEVGAIVWRRANLFELGNWLNPHHHARTRMPARTSNIITIDEEETLLEYRTTLSSRNVRERVFVGDANGRKGAVVKGYNPLGGTGLMRVAGWTDQHFEDNQECLVAADLIVARQMFDYRRSTMTIPANPAIQVDDQIRIYERITNETYYHYVISVGSELDMDDGTWTYQLETHWLGEEPEDAWVLDVTKLKQATKDALELHGLPDGGIADEEEG